MQTFWTKRKLLTRIKMPFCPWRPRVKITQWRKIFGFNTFLLKNLIYSQFQLRIWNLLRSKFNSRSPHNNRWIEVEVAISSRITISSSNLTEAKVECLIKEVIDREVHLIILRQSSASSTIKVSLKSSNIRKRPFT